MVFFLFLRKQKFLRKMHAMVSSRKGRDYGWLVPILIHSCTHRLST